MPIGSESRSLPEQMQSALHDLTSAPELRPILASVAACTRTATESSAAVVVLHQGDNPKLVEAAGVNGHSEAAKRLVLDALEDDESALATVMRSGRPLLMADIAGDPRLAALDRRAQSHVASMAVVPLFDSADVIGVLTVCYELPNDLGPEVLDLITAFAHLIVQTVTAERSRVTISGLEDADRRQMDLIGTVAHELRAPIQASIGFVATVLMHWERLNEDERRALLERVAKNATREAHLVDELLDFSRLESGRSHTAPRLCDLSAEIRERVESLAPLLESHEIVLSLPPELEVFIDPDMLTTVLTNLLTNAMKFSPDATRIEIEAVQGEDEAIVSVTDRGRGVEEQERVRIFEPFFQCGGHTSAAGGAGLGLALVKRCIDRCGGRIWVQDTSGPGSTFSFSLPISRPAGPPDGTIRTTGRRAGGQDDEQRRGQDRRLGERRAVPR